MKARKLKIQPFTIPGLSFRRMKIYPQLIIRGKWFHDAGFHPDSTVHILVEHGRLIIEPSKTERSAS